MKTFPLTPDVPFVEGQVFTPDLAYQAFYSPIFDDQTSYLGHRERITDDELDNGAGSIKAKVNAVENGLKVTVETGLTLRHAAGSLRLPDGSVVTKATALFTAPNNATSFAYFDQAGNIQCTTQAPALRSLLAQVVTVSGAVSSLTDLRHPAQRMVNPIAAAIKVFGGTNTTDKVCTAGEVFDQGLYYFRDFTVPSGITITVDKFARFYCSGNVSILGTINVTPASAGASGYSTQGLTGVNQGGLMGAGVGAGSGASSTGATGASYSYAVQPYGSGGGLGLGTGGTGVFFFGDGGRGGGGLWFEATGTITMTGATINLSGENGQAHTILSNPVAISGSGGGSGGTLTLSSLVSINIAASCNILLNGGNGGNASNTASGLLAQGGSGGGGGQFVAIAPSVNYSGANINVAGGALGTAAGTGTAIGGGGGGGNGGNGGRQSTGSAGRIIQRLFVPIGS